MESPSPEPRPSQPDDGAAAAVLLDSADWHLVSPSGQSERSSLERARSTAAVSRPQTPTKAHDADLAAGLRALEEAAAEPAANDAGAAFSHEAGAEASDASQEVVGVHSLQGLSQEGSLEGFAASEPPPATGLLSVAPPPAAHLAAAPGGKGQWVLGLVDAMLGLDSAAAPLHLRDALVKLLGEALGWARGHLLDACRAGLESLQLYLALTQQTLALGARGAGAAHAHLAGALGRAHALLLRRAALVLPTTSAPAQAHAGAQEEEGDGADDLKAHSGGARAAAAAARPPTSLRAGVVVLSAALGLTSLASLAGLVFYVGRCRQLTTQLQQRDRELARLVVKILNLQDALHPAGRGGGVPVPVLRQTTLLSGLV